MQQLIFKKKKKALKFYDINGVNPSPRETNYYSFHVLLTYYVMITATKENGQFFKMAWVSHGIYHELVYHVFNEGITWKVKFDKRLWLRNLPEKKMHICKCLCQWAMFYEKWNELCYMKGAWVLFLIQAQPRGNHSDINVIRTGRKRNER